MSCSLAMIGFTVSLKPHEEALGMLEEKRMLSEEPMKTRFLSCGISLGWNSYVVRLVRMWKFPSGIFLEAGSNTTT